MIVLALSGLIPEGRRRVLTRVRLDLSRAFEKVEQGGARCTTKRRRRSFRLWAILPFLVFMRQHCCNFSFKRLTAFRSRKFVPPDAASSGGSVSTPASLTAFVSRPLPAKTSRKRSLDQFRLPFSRILCLFGEDAEGWRPCAGSLIWLSRGPAGGAHEPALIPESVAGCAASH